MSGNGFIDFNEFSAIMDVLINGDEKERSFFSFALMDEDRSGHLNFKEFFSYISKVVAHWSSMINSHVRVDREAMKKVFG